MNKPRNQLALLSLFVASALLVGTFFGWDNALKYVGLAVTCAVVIALELSYDPHQHPQEKAEAEDRYVRKIVTEFAEREKQERVNRVMAALKDEATPQRAREAEGADDDTDWNSTEWEAGSNGRRIA